MPMSNSPVAPTRVSQEASAAQQRAAVANEPRFLRACRGERTDRTPVWFMRQAGRYMPEYRAIRANHTLLQICAQPELATEVTLQPVRALGVDAAIIFADILLPLVPMGINLEFAAGEGPVIHNPVRTPGDIAALRAVESGESLAHVLQAIRMVRRELADRTPLIGFAGAPFTLASYLIEGGSSRQQLATRRLMLADPAAWHALLGKLAIVVADYLAAQVHAGAQAVQLFDSWVGCLSPDDYREYVLPHTRRIFAAIEPLGVPMIHFGVDTATLLPLMREAAGERSVIGMDWRIPLSDGWARLGAGAKVQGNLDPVALFAPRAELERRVRAVLKEAAGRPGHIFNLGHGILPGTPVDNVRFVVDLVHALTGADTSAAVLPAQATFGAEGAEGAGRDR
ncbi:MAG: uroporphyrinogen decarboxylase [Gemmatimonadaceae bacterium]